MKLAKHSPGRRQLDRVEIRAGRLEKSPQALGGEIETVLLPPQPGLFAKPGRGPDEGSSRRRPPLWRRRPAPGGGDDQQAATCGQVVAVEGGVLGVVQARDERPDAGLHDGSHRLEAAFDSRGIHNHDQGPAPVVGGRAAPRRAPRPARLPNPKRAGEARAPPPSAGRGGARQTFRPAARPRDPAPCPRRCRSGLTPGPKSGSR